ncbi:MAG: Ribonuclease 3 [Bacteroidetes bacterium ADurb.Bin397]|nr:MAG: Ribonuclease 3 [Bacteroidetes bacterium ADurb.Bin397]
MDFLLPYRLLFSGDKELILSLRNILGFYPKNIAIYKLAFSHRSVAPTTVNGMQMSNERLEYLGDAVLGAIVAELLFRRFPFRDEGFLTEMRSRLVSREHLKSLALKIGLDKYIKNNSGPGMYRSMYGDAFEALVGAIFLDKGYKAAEHFIVDRMIRLHVDLNDIELADSNFKSRIINWAQREKKSIVFETLEEGNGNKLIKVRLVIDGEEISTGADFVKKKAEQIAAGKACEILKVLPDSKDDQ